MHLAKEFFMRLIINCFLDPTGVSQTAHIMFLLWNQVDSKFQNKSGHKDFGWGIVNSNHSIIVYKSRYLMFLLLVVAAARFVTQSCLTPCDPMGCSTPGFLVLHYLLEFAQTHVQSMMPFNHLILCHSLLLMLSVFPSIRVFSNDFYCLNLHDFIWKISRCSFS